MPRTKKGTAPKAAVMGIVLPIESDEANILWKNEARWPLIKKMRRTDPSVIGFLHAYKDPIKTTTWSIIGENQEHVDFVKQNLFDRIEWNDFVELALAYLDYGNMVFEKCWVNESGKWWLTDLSPRYPWTVTWKRDPGNTQWLGVTQSVPGKGTVLIPRDKLMLFCNEREGDDLSGVSVLRQIYKPWKLKEKTEMTMDTIIQRNGMGIPVANAPDTVDPDDEAAMILQLRNISSNENAFFFEKGGVTFRFQGVDGNTVDPTPFLSHCNMDIREAGAQGVYALSSSNRGSSGSGDTLGGLYYDRIAAVANHLCGVINKQLIPQMIDYNFGLQVEPIYPKITSAGIAAKGIFTKAEAIAHLIAAGVIWPEKGINQWIRGALDIPPLPPGQEEAPVPEPVDNETSSTDIATEKKSVGPRDSTLGKVKKETTKPVKGAPNGKTSK